MTVAVTPSQSDIQTALRAFLLAVLPDGTDVVQTQDNRVPQPNVVDFVTMTPLRRGRLSTNVDRYADAAYAASIAGDLMTVTAVAIGPIKVDRALFGAGLAANSRIVSQASGDAGGIGQYVVSPAQSLSSRALASGGLEALQPTQVDVQLDVYGPASADNAQIISTLLRDPYGVAKFAESGFDVSPLYAIDPRQAPFVDEQNQYENRWIVEAALQANQVVLGVPQQFADSVAVGLVSVDATYPPEG